MNGIRSLKEDSAFRDVVLIAVDIRQKCGNLMIDGKERTKKEGIAESVITSLKRIKKKSFFDYLKSPVYIKTLQ